MGNTPIKSEADFLGVAQHIAAPRQFQGYKGFETRLYLHLPDLLSRPLPQGLWLVWRYQGASSLEWFLRRRDALPLLAGAVLGESAMLVRNSPEDLLQRDCAVVQAVMRHLLESLQAIHATGGAHYPVRKTRTCLKPPRKGAVLCFGMLSIAMIVGPGKLKALRMGPLNLDSVNNRFITSTGMAAIHSCEGVTHQMWS